MATSASDLGRIQSRFEEHRLFFRKRILQPISIELSPGKNAWLYDLSEGGLRVYDGPSVDLGTSACIRFQFPETNTVIDASGVVAWSDPSGRAGIRFTHMQPESSAGLRGWLESESPGAEPVATASVNDDLVFASRISSLAHVSDLQAEISSGQLDREAALDLIVRRMMELTRAAGAAIALREGDDVVCRASVGNAPDVGVPLSSSSLSGECFRTGTVVLLSDSESDSRVDPEICRQLNFRSLLVLPITAGEESIGIAEVLSPNPRNFEGGDILVMSFLAEMVVSLTEGVKAAPEPELKDVVSLLSVGEPLIGPEAAAEESMPSVLASTEPAANEQGVAPALLSAPTVASQEPASAPIPETPAPIVAAPLPVMLDPLPALVTEQPVLPGPIQAAVAAPADIPLERTLEAAVGSSIIVPTMADTPARRTPIPETELLSPETKEIAIGPASFLEPKFATIRLAGPHKATWILALCTAIVGLVVSAVLLFSYHGRSAAPAPAPSVAVPAATKSSVISTPPIAITPAPSPANGPNASKPTAPSGTRPASSLAKLRQSEGDELLVIHPAGILRPIPAPDSPAPEAPQIAVANGGLGTLPVSVTAAAPKPKLQASQSQGVTPGRLLKKVAPNYPDLAFHASVSGDVVLVAVIGTDGLLHNIKAISGSPMLRQEAIAAAKQWRYIPATLSGKPVESDTRITINFHR